MSARIPSIFVAVVGGSGAGKTWLASRLQRVLGENAACLSLDDFYLDRSRLPPSRRGTINFDHPRAIDWPALDSVLLQCKAGLSAPIPRYDFSTHARIARDDAWKPKPVIIIDGLWLLRRPALRSFFDLSIFIQSPANLRLQRRVRRDQTERGRAPATARRQFHSCVHPMHKLFVEPQARWADVILRQPFNERDVDRLARALWDFTANGAIHPGRTRETFNAQLQSLLLTHYE